MQFDIFYSMNLMVYTMVLSAIVCVTVCKEWLYSNTIRSIYVVLSGMITLDRVQS